MQIQLCEDDGLFHEGGIPTMVIILVKFDDGKTKRIPYPADKPISALYQDLRAIEPQIKESSELKAIKSLESFIPIEEQMSTDRPGIHQEDASNATPSVIKQPSTAVKQDRSHVIEKEDIITLIKLNPRDTVYHGTLSPLIIGMDYRVIAVLGPKIPTPDGKGIRQVIQGFEVLDDHAATPERMIVTPDEVQLKSKRLSKIIEKTTAVEEILPCPNCQVHNSLILKGTDFVGTCQACNAEITIARIIKKCGTPKCTNQVTNQPSEVSCFDVGGKYEGQCGECRTKIEVPYA